MKTLSVGFTAVALLVASASIGAAQNASEPAANASVSSLPTLIVDVVISRYTGERADKKVSSVPYTLTVSPRQAPTSIRIGNRVPIPTTLFNQPSPDGSKPAPTPVTAFQYQDIGINIDCRAGVRTDGRYDITLSIEESSVVSPSQVQAVQAGGAPVIRTLRVSDTSAVRDGETRQFIAASDRVTGETVKIDVSVHASK